MICLQGRMLSEINCIITVIVYHSHSVVVIIIPQSRGRGRGSPPARPDTSVTAPEVSRVSRPRFHRLYPYHAMIPYCVTPYYDAGRVSNSSACSCSPPNGTIPFDSSNSEVIWTTVVGHLLSFSTLYCSFPRLSPSHRLPRLAYVVHFCHPVSPHRYALYASDLHLPYLYRPRVSLLLRNATSARRIRQDCDVTSPLPA